MTKTNKPTKTFNLYDDSIAVDFYEKYGRYTHVYIRKDTGEWLKSVTGATGIIDKPMLIPWACKMMANNLNDKLADGIVITEAEVNRAKSAWRIKRDSSAEKGTIIHDLAHQYIEYKLGKVKKMPAIPKDEEIQNAFIAFKDWEAEHNVKFLETERLVYSKKFNFVGTLDCIAEVNGEHSLIDFKTGNGIYGEMLYQVSGYGIAYEEEVKKKFDRNWIVRFSKDNAEFNAKDFKTDNKLRKGFLSCLFLKNMQDEIKNLIK